MNKGINVRELWQEIERVLMLTDDHSCNQGETVPYGKMAKEITIYLDEHYEITKCKS